MIDIHTHLHFKDYDADRDAVIARARDAGVDSMILVGTDLDTSRGAIALAEQYDFLYASVGIHPHEFNAGVPVCHSRAGGDPEEETGSRVKPGMTEGDDGESGWVAALRELAEHPKVVAIGECGLDYFSRDPERPITRDQKAWQREGFLAQMETAKELGLPMIIHTRPSAGTMDAYEDVFGILQSEIVNPQSAILHCYQGDSTVTKKFLTLPNVFFSFAGSITYPVKKSLVGTKDDPAAVIQLIPAGRMFVETDCPYLAPQPVRGSRNEPAYVAMTADALAACKGMTREGLDATVGSSALAVFRAMLKRKE